MIGVRLRQIFERPWQSMELNSGLLKYNHLYKGGIFAIPTLENTIL